MAGLFIELPAAFWLPPVATVGNLPATGDPIGAVRLVLASGIPYWFNGTIWQTEPGSVDFISAVSNTNSINLTNTAGTLTADLKLSAAAADANNLKSTYSIKADGIFIENPYATAIQTGVLTSADWATFNAKESAITATSAADYYRGDKTFQPLSSAVRILVSASSPLFYDNTTGIFTIQVATAGQNGYLSSVDFSTFNSKEPAIVAGTTAQYWRGDKTFQSLSAAVRPLVTATSPLNYNNGTGVFTINVATSIDSGYLTNTDWNTFNNKEPAISSGSTSQYWRGDKSFQTLNTAAIVPNAGSSAASGKIGEIVTSAVTAATTTGVGATGVYGNVTSIALTAGDWVLTGVAGFQENGATLTTSLSCGFSTATNGSTLGALDAAVYNNLISSTSDLVAPSPTLNVIVPGGGATYYLNTRFFYTSGTPKHYGGIEARRAS